MQNKELVPGAGAERQDRGQKDRSGRQKHGKELEKREPHGEVLWQGIWVESGGLAEELPRKQAIGVIIYRCLCVFIMKPQAGKAPQYLAPRRGVLGYHTGHLERVHRQQVQCPLF